MCYIYCLKACNEVLNDLTHHSSVTPPAPCPPTQLRVDSSCDSSNISVSWLASQGSVSYMAMAEDAEGRQWSCNTNSTTCHISGLLCGQQYKVYAAGVDEKCIGAKSNVEMIQTGRYLNLRHIYSYSTSLIKKAFYNNLMI